MTIGTIELAEQELLLLEQIDFNWHSHNSGRRSCDAAARLMPLLLRRKAIPERRLRYFDDPELNGGRKSRLQVFEGNGTVGVDIFGHGNFLRHLRYFIHGAALPERIKARWPSWSVTRRISPVATLSRRASSLGSWLDRLGSDRLRRTAFSS